MTLFIGAAIGGLTLGGVFALISLGLVFAFRATRVFNFAQGELLLLPAFIVGFMEERHSSVALALVLAFAATVFIAVAFYFIALRRTAGQEIFMGIIATLGLATMLDGIMGITFPVGTYQVKIGILPTGSTRLLGTSVGNAQIAITLVALAISIAIILTMRYTHIGVSIVAAGHDPVLASQCGLHVRRLHAGSWALAGVLSVIAGLSYGAVASANTAVIELGLAALPAVMLGGLDSIDGAVVGGFIIGLVESFAQVYLGGQYVNAITYGILLSVMLIFPQGLFGSKEVVRA